jgi:hypothetical protein
LRLGFFAGRWFSVVFADFFEVSLGVEGLDSRGSKTALKMSGSSSKAMRCLPVA